MSTEKLDLCFISPKLYHYVHPTEDNAAGGAQRQQYLIGKELSSRGHDISFIVGDYGQPNRIEINNIKVWKGCPKHDGLDGKLPVRMVKLLYVMKKVDADIYYVRGAPPLCASIYMLSKALKSNFAFCLANDKDVKKDEISQFPFFVKTAYLRALSDADFLVTQTNKQKRMTKKLVGQDSKVISNGYTVETQQDIKDHNNRNTVLWIGTDDYDQKRPDRFLDLAASLPSMDFTMICRQTNDVQYHRELEQRSKSIPNLTFINSVHPDEIYKYYNDSYMLINTSEYEGFPNVFLESWKYKTPVISHSFSLDGLLSSKSVGYVSGSMKELIKDTSKLAEDVEKRKHLGENGRNLLQNEFSIEKVADEYESYMIEMEKANSAV
ncbi:glycosyltransferase family 4 protein [Natronococcus amylolyticus]|uniref:glycosyltransferase family 4 protein n=1 Tax=Natronococcus amylolyticus TaxID=44470 RepID=UPI000A0304AC|nr:glycosyltransferase family 4 protein [Natronococcus amylolyticus]